MEKIRPEACEVGVNLRVQRRQATVLATTAGNTVGGGAQRRRGSVVHHDFDCNWYSYLRTDDVHASD